MSEHPSMFSKAADLIREGNVIRGEWGMVINGVPCYCAGGALGAADNPAARIVVRKFGEDALEASPSPSAYADRAQGAILAIVNRDRNYDPRNREGQDDVHRRQVREFKAAGRRKPRWEDVPEWNDHASKGGRFIRKPEVLAILDKAHRLYGKDFPLLNEKPPVSVYAA